MKSPQSPHSSSLWVFALSLRVLSELPPSAAINHLATKLSFYGFSVVGLRVISLGSKSHTRTLTGTAPSTSFWSPLRGRFLFWLKGLPTFCFSAAYHSLATCSFYFIIAQLYFASRPLSFIATLACATHLFHVPFCALHYF